MRIVHFVLSKNFSGIEQHVNELIENNMKNECILVCNESIAKKFNKNINKKIIKNYGRYSLFGMYTLKKLFSQINPDIVHTHGSKTTRFISSIGKKRFKHVATIHGVKKVLKSYEKSDLIIGVSRTVVRNITNKIEIIHNWYHPNLKKFEQKSSDYALSIGRLEKVKGFDLLIKSWKNIDKNLKIIGSGSEKNQLNRLIRKHKLENKIEIYDCVNREKLINFYEGASVLIIPSRNEGGPRVALEALYLGIPVLSTDVGHMNEILPKEFLAKKNDLESLKHLLNEYVDKISYVNQAAIFKHVSESYSIESKIKQINDAYKNLVA